VEPLRTGVPQNTGSVTINRWTYRVTVAEEEDGYETPEELALADWPSASGVRVVSVEVRGDRAEVHLDMGPTYDYWVYCLKVDGRWHETVSGNAPTTGWDDPNEIDWSW
jgi:hypothetical protein